MCMSLERAYKMENISMGQWKVSSPPLYLLLSLSPTLLPTWLPLSLHPSLRGPRVALPGGLAPNHPERVGGNQRLPAGCLVIVTPWDPHTFLHTQVQHTDSDMLTKTFALISWHLSIHVFPTTWSRRGRSLETFTYEQAKVPLNQFKPV